MSKSKRGEITCDACGGWDIEWMYKCHKHGCDTCRGCSCPVCDEDEDELLGGEYWDEDALMPNPTPIERTNG